VVCHGEGPLLVIAGPGSGKTRVLIHRIAWLLETEVARPWEVLAVTFSVRAAAELQMRLADMLGVERAAGVRAATFHSVCARLLRAHGERCGRRDGWTIYDQTEVRRTIDWLISEKQRGEVARALESHRIASGEIQREISAAKNRLLSPAAYERSAVHEAAPLIAQVWAELEQEMAQRNALDFDDLLVRAVGLLAGQPHILMGLQRQYRWLLIDEVQDTCPAQLELACLLAGADGQVTAVGDADQCIFSFRQADPQGMNRLAELFPGYRKLPLRQNFRSRAEILAAASRCVQNNTGREPGASIATRGGGGHAAARRFGDERREAEWIARQAGRALEAGWEASEVLVLCRTAHATGRVQEELRHAGIAHRVLGSLGLYERAEIRDALCYLTLLINPRDVHAFGRAVGSPRRGIGEQSIARLVALAREHHGGDLLAACGDPGALQLLPSDRAREKLQAFAQGLERAAGELRAGRSLAHVAVSALTMRGGLVATRQWIRDHHERADRRRDAERVLEDLRSLCRHVQAYEEQDAAPSMVGFLERAAGLDPEHLEEGEVDRRVTVSTIHRSKGGEARLVMLIGCEERLLPIRQAIESGQVAAIEEERRLFYVACTRAKDHLVVTWCANREGRPTAGPSRFLTEAGLIEPAPASAAARKAA
jgi:DNA helicase-2/ATP-dependent DNA helicase PcrA